MNREILFRGKRVDNGEWVEGFLFNNNAITPLTATYTQTSMGDIVNGIKEVIPETIGQFTGLTDKNGKKIFEGDICLDINGKKRVVEYEFGAWSWQYYESPDIDWEIIGNIHDK